jgi:glyceraldehyde 3-phosphate dehydrogenase
LKSRVFINGFGRIGRALFRILMQDNDIEVVGINDIYDFEYFYRLLKFDSIYGEYDQDRVELREDILTVGERRIQLSKISDPKNLDLSGIDLLINCTGIFLGRRENEIFLKKGAKRVLISAPAKDGIETYIVDINYDRYKGEDLVSNSSCSLNAIAPILKIVDEKLRVLNLSASMYHSYTAYQSLLDVKHYSKDIRRCRSATQNILPLVSSVESEAVKLFPNLKSKIYAKSIRVPVKAVTLYDLTMQVEKGVKKEELNTLLINESKNFPSLDITDKPKTSSNFIASPFGATIDINLTQIVDDDLIKIFAWQDNEWGYANQLYRAVKRLTAS